MADLKPCPFCGCEAVYETFRQEHWFGTKEPIVFCNGCKVEFSIEDESPFLNVDEDYKWRKKKTAEAWNRRVLKMRLIDADNVVLTRWMEVASDDTQ